MTATQAPPNTKTFRVEGMTCTSCAAKVQSQLEALPGDASARVDKATDTATVELAVPAGRVYLQEAIDPKYRLRDAPAGGAASLEGTLPQNPSPTHHDAPHAPLSPAADEADDRSWLETYRPLLTIVGLIALVTVLAEASSAGAFDFRTWMRLFMAGFFIVFAGFKLLDLAGFSESLDQRS